MSIRNSVQLATSAFSRRSSPTAPTGPTISNETPVVPFSLENKKVLPIDSEFEEIPLENKVDFSRNPNDTTANSNLNIGPNLIPVKKKSALMKNIATLMKPLSVLNSLISKYYVRSLIVIIILFVIVNIVWFNSMDANSSDLAFNRTVIGPEGDKQFKCSNATDGLYFTFTTLSTVGYGDIAPLSSAAKQWTTLMHVIIIYLTLKLCDYAYNSGDGEENSANTYILIIKDLQKKINVKNAKIREKNIQIAELTTPTILETPKPKTSLADAANQVKNFNILSRRDATKPEKITRSNANEFDRQNGLLG
jgi:hypothetical protein